MAEVPGLKWVPKPTVMDMSYDKNFTDAYVGDAYERVLLAAGPLLSRPAEWYHPIAPDPRSA